MESTTDTLTEDDDIDDTAVSLSGWSMSGKQGSVFSDIDLEVPTGAIAIVRGPAGSGKTSFLLSWPDGCGSRRGRAASAIWISANRPAPSA
jgi:iron complex transport system ATP-binding protein